MGEADFKVSVAVDTITECNDIVKRYSKEWAFGQIGIPELRLWLYYYRVQRLIQLLNLERKVGKFRQ